VGDRAGAFTDRTDVRLGPWLAARALAGAAGGVGGEAQGDRDAVDGVGEADRGRRLDVLALAGPLRASSPGEHVTEDVTEAAAPTATAAAAVADEVVEV